MFNGCKCLSLEKVRAETPGAVGYCGACKALPQAEQRSPGHALGRLECSLPGKHLCCEVSWSQTLLLSLSCFILQSLQHGTCIVEQDHP